LVNDLVAKDIGLLTQIDGGPLVLDLSWGWCDRVFDVRWATEQLAE
jgi:hypothetical protein